MTKIKYYLVLLLMGATILTKAQESRPHTKDRLADALFGFEKIQDSTRTKTWWFHGETETTKEGITADLEAFKNQGVGGVIYYDQSHGKAENALPGFSPEWWKMFRFSAMEAQRFGLSFEVHVSNGFVAGGNWITHEHSMKRLAAIEKVIKGGAYFEGKLEQPSNKYNFSRDIAVIAFPAKSGVGTSSRSKNVKMSTNTPSIDLEKLVDPTIESLAVIKAPKDGKPVYINFEFDEPFQARSITYEARPRGKATTSATNIPAPPQDTFVGTGYRILPDLGQLEVSSDGVYYQKVCDVKPLYRAHESWRQKSISFSTVKGKYYRLNLNNWWEANDPSPDMQLGKLVINGAAMVDQWEEKAGFFSEYMEENNTPTYTPDEVIARSTIIDLTDKMDQEGILRWDAPAGDWMIMRFAYVPTGGVSKHGRANLMGLECDKLSAAAAEVQWENYVQVMLDSLKLHQIDNLVGVAMDSHEAGTQNWTTDFVDEFRLRRGYDPTLLLPTMMGYVIDSKEQSSSFLFDIRRNIADMITDNYYGTLDRLCRENGLVFTAQATGNALCIVADPIQAKSAVAKPQGEFWQIHPDGNYDIKESASAAHLYGKHIASAEAYTDAKYSASLADLKSLADYAFAFGINEFVICASAYQPWIDKFPGSTGGGRHYCINRNNTWWDYSSSFWDYQARAAYILRKGRQQTDLCIYLGEDPPVKILTHRLPDLPAGFDFDAFTADALHTRMDAEPGRIVLPDGHSYRMMVLPSNGKISYKVLQKISQLVDKGAVVYGRRPQQYGSITGLANSLQFENLVNKMWGETGTGIAAKNFGQGLIIQAGSLTEALASVGIQPDVSLKTGNVKDKMMYYVHRKLDDADVYFIDNHKDKKEFNDFTFASSRRHAQLWDLVSGKRYKLNSTRSAMGGRTVSLAFAPRESYMVVLTDQQEDLPIYTLWKQPRHVLNLNEAWSVKFDGKKGGPGEVKWDSLIDWTKSDIDGIKYYSGTASYRKDITLNKDNGGTFLCVKALGSVAEVWINGKIAGTIWCAPWRLDIGALLVAGHNQIEIRVTNSLVNRMVLDAGLPERDRITYAYPPIASVNDDLVPSGLLAVTLEQY